MTHKDIEMEVLARYLSGESTDAEKDRVEQWIEADTANRQKFNQYKRIWNMSDTPVDFTSDRFDAEEDWEKLSRKIDQVITQESTAGAGDPSRYETAKKPGWNIFLRAAAILLIAGLIGVFAYHQWPSGQAEKKSALRQITTEMGQRVNLTLSDGTEVLLNADSEIKLPEVFDSDRREVYLSGQAFFSVASNPEKPFIIHSGETLTRVLGTEFSIRAYPDDEQITVAVREGSVAFQSTADNETILKDHELAFYNSTTRQLKSRKIEDVELYLGWVDGYLKFNETPMAEVATALERRYGLTVSFADESIKQKLLTALLKSRSIRNVLDVISMSLDIGYKIDGDRVIFLES